MYHNILLPLVGVWFQVLFHSSVRSAFHLSFTVLVHYRSLFRIQPYRMVPVDSCQIPPVSQYSGYILSYIDTFYIRGFHPLWHTFPGISIIYLYRIYRIFLQPHACFHNHGLGFSLFARHYSGNHYCFLFLQVLRCFSSPGSPPYGCTVFNCTGCPIRKSTDHRLFASPRSLSQLITSFFAVESLGIPHTPLFNSFDTFIPLLALTFLHHVKDL